MMQLNKVLEQHIAVFGESGSGKTVLVSSFYGAMQEPQFLKSSLYTVTADDAGQGHRLHSNYLGMKDSARVPGQTKFAAVPYAFSVKLRDKAATGSTPKSFDAVRLLWHDYPGEWFQQDVSGPEEAHRRVETFKSLLGSDVALLLVDGQKFLDNAGAEERYLKSVFTSFRTGLVRLRDELLDEGKPLVRFPRIWVLALSKTDLLPDMDVYAFRDLVIGKASGELDELRREIQQLVDTPDALAVGEDFVLLSSAKFEPGKIEVSERIGVDLMLPLAAMLPLERHVRWVDQLQVGARVVEELLNGVGPLALAVIGKSKFANPKLLIAALVGRRAVTKAMSVITTLSVEQLKKMHTDALAKHDHMAAVLTQFKLDLERAQANGVLHRSER